MTISKPQLDALEKNLKELFDKSLFGIAILDINGTILEINKAISKITGFTREELLGKNFNEVQAVPPEWWLDQAVLVGQAINLPFDDNQVAFIYVF